MNILSQKAFIIFQTVHLSTMTLQWLADVGAAVGQVAEVYEAFQEDADALNNQKNEYRQEAQRYLQEIVKLRNQLNMSNLGSARNSIQQQIQNLQNRQNEANLNARKCILKINKQNMPDALGLHGLFVEEAKAEVLYAIANFRNLRRPFHISTPVERYSQNGMPLMLPAVREILERECLKFEEKEPGHFYVTF